MSCLLRLGPLSLSPHTVGTTGPLPLSPSGPQAQTAGQSPGRGALPVSLRPAPCPPPARTPSASPRGCTLHTPESGTEAGPPLPSTFAGSRAGGRLPAGPQSGCVAGAPLSHACLGACHRPRLAPRSPRCSARHLTPTPGLGAPLPRSGAAGPPPQSPASPPVCGHRGRSPHEEPGPRPRLGVPGLVPSRGLFLWLPDFRRLRACPSDPAPLCAWRSCASELDGPPTQPEGRRAPSLPSARGQGSHWAGVGNISTG